MAAKEFKHYFVEVILILSIVLIFRSAWTLMDKSAMLTNDLALWVMLIVGLMATVFSFNWLFAHKRLEH